MNKDSTGRDSALDAGPLVTADEGCCCIDELEKMTSQHQALLEVMRRRNICVAKAGVICRYGIVFHKIIVSNYLFLLSNFSKELFTKLFTLLVLTDGTDRIMLLT